MVTNRLSIFGLGYVGSVMAACLSGRGHEVVGVDSNSLKTEMMNSGHCPIVEPGVEALISAAHAKRLLRATTDFKEAVRQSEVSFICVGTPSKSNGNLDLSSVAVVCGQIGQALRHRAEFHTVVLRSTMLPGTAEQSAIPILERESGKREGLDFAVCVNPEFLREGSAVRDFMQPSMTVLGAGDPAHLDILSSLYSFTSAPIFRTTLKTAEMVKYASNGFHALKIAFANEIATIGAAIGVDTAELATIFCSDTKLNISAAYLKPGFAFGGSCLPKDLRALAYRAKELDIDVPLLQSILPSNQLHMMRAVQSVLESGKRRVGLLGLSFKPGTDDLRESPYVRVIKRLLGEGCEVRIWDKNVSLGFVLGSNRQYINAMIPHISPLLCDHVEEVLDFAEVVLIGSHNVRAKDLPLRPGQLMFDLNQPSKLAQPVSAGAD